jgi:glycosyltransferase involved in cell wall biosynthesis
VYRGLRVAVVVPALNEADKIGATVRSIPRFVDHAVVVDDGSEDSTPTRAREALLPTERVPTVAVLVHDRNRGVGAAIATGYEHALEVGADVVVVMAGDGQMDPDDLPGLLEPIVEGRADYAKGNRLAWPGGWRQMPPVRLAGSLALSLLTQVATGYGDVFDSQCGYTAVSRAALLALEPARMYPRYGYPNDVLARLAALGARVVDVPVRPVYGAAWRSGLSPARVVAPVGRILVRAFADRLRRRVRGRTTIVAEPPVCASDS